LKSAVILSAAIIATALVAMMGLYLYYSPYQSCVRALLAADYEPAEAALACLHGVERDTDSEPAYGGSRARHEPRAWSMGNCTPEMRTRRSERRLRNRRARRLRTGPGSG
jgi:predicted acyl esterase